jgi:hypothetical protein
MYQIKSQHQAADNAPSPKLEADHSILDMLYQYASAASVRIWFASLNAQMGMSFFDSTSVLQRPDTWLECLN